MKVIAQRLWSEPAAAIGLITSLILLVLQLVGDNDFTADTIIAIVAPFAAALGIRQVVTPVVKVDELLEATPPSSPPGRP